MNPMNYSLWRKIQSFGIFKNILFLTWKFENPLIVLQTCVEVNFVPHQSWVLKQFWKYNDYSKFLNMCVLYIPWICCSGCDFFQFVSLID